MPALVELIGPRVWWPSALAREEERERPGARSRSRHDGRGGPLGHRRVRAAGGDRLGGRRSVRRREPGGRGAGGQPAAAAGADRRAAPARADPRRAARRGPLRAVARGGARPQRAAPSPGADRAPGGRAGRALGDRGPDPGRDQPADVDLRDGAGGARDGAGGGRVDDREGRLAGGLGRRAHARRLAREPDRPARRARRGRARTRGSTGVDGTLAVLAPPGSHYSVKRSVAMLGLGERAVVDLEVDEYERIVPDALGDALDALRGGGPPADGAGGGRVRHEHRAPRRPRGDRRVLPRARDLVPRGRRPRRDGAAVAGAPAPAEGHRARRLGDLGRPQDDAHARARRRGAASRRAPARGGVPPEGGLPDLRGLGGGVAEPARAPGGVHEGRARDADLHEPGLPRRGRTSVATWATSTTRPRASTS